MKIIFNEVTKRVPDVKDYFELVGHLHKTLKLPGTSEIGENLKLFYIDEDGDVICITCQDDLNEAYSLQPKLKLCLS
jgi:hypothetical protein